MNTQLDLSNIVDPINSKLDLLLKGQAEIKANQEKLISMLSTPDPKPQPVFSVALSDNQLGPYHLADWQKDWNDPNGKPWQPLTFLSIVQDALKERSIRFLFPKDTGYGNKGGGSNFKGNLQKALESAVLSYKIKFDKNFKWMLGGKMPGFRNTPSLSGGRGSQMTESMGFSGRMMWDKYGKMRIYFYSQGMPDDYGWGLGEGTFGQLIPDTWHEIEFEITMNTVGQRNGVVRVKQDGELVAEVTNAVLRTASSPQLITEIYMDVFMGGADSRWAPDEADQGLEIKDIQVYDKLINT